MPKADNIGSADPGHYGVTGGAGLTLQRAPIALAWNLQGDATRAAFAEQIQRLFGLGRLPATHGIEAGARLDVLWLGPTSWLLLGKGPIQPPHPCSDFRSSRDAVSTADGALFDVSASRIALRIGGPAASVVLASGCPLDLHARAFPGGTCAQSLFGHIAALYCRTADAGFTLLVARSLADEVWTGLCSAGAQYGYEVLAAEPWR